MRNLGILLFCVAVVVVGWYVFVGSRSEPEAAPPAVGAGADPTERDADTSFTTAEKLKRSQEAARLLREASEAEEAGDRQRTEQLLGQAAAYVETWAGGEARRRLAALAAGSDAAGGTSPTDKGGASPQPKSQAIPDESPVKPDTTYTVEPGDSLWQISRKLGVTLEQLMLENNRRDTTIRPGDRLKVSWRMPTIFVDKEGMKLHFTYRGKLLRSYPVGIGKAEAESGESVTPEGVFVIENRIKNPPWYHGGQRIEYGDPRNILGTRWMGLKPTSELSGYGIHGTTQPETVPGRHSEGCIRMLNAHVEELFLWTPIGTKVHIYARWSPPTGSGAAGK